jgi:hypothetical protein
MLMVVSVRLWLMKKSRQTDIERVIETESQAGDGTV